MKTKIYLIFSSIIISVFLISLVSAACCDRTNTNDKRICQTSYQIRPGNQINQQIPHFKCCNCESGNCDCVCAGENCNMGDTLSKHIVFTRIDNCGTNCKGSAEADVDAYNYNGRDKVKIVLRTMNLMPRDSIYTVWLVDEPTNNKMYIGEFKTNKNGRAIFTFRQQMADFTIYDKIVVMKGDTGVLVGNLNFKCTGEGKTDPSM